DRHQVASPHLAPDDIALGNEKIPHRLVEIDLAWQLPAHLAPSPSPSRSAIPTGGIALSGYCGRRRAAIDFATPRGCGIQRAGGGAVRMKAAMILSIVLPSSDSGTRRHWHCRSLRSMTKL